MDATALGLRIKFARLTKRVLQRELAAALDISASRLSDLERGWKTPTEQELAQLCAYLGLSPADLRGPEEEM
jgi:transcriptional regulator with XRE-family HTH domain